MAKIIILKRSGEIIEKKILETVFEAWEVMIGLKLPEDASEQIIELSIDARNGRRSPISDWAVFTDIDGKNMIVNKRYVAWIEE